MSKLGQLVIFLGRRRGLINKIYGLRGKCGVCSSRRSFLTVPCGTVRPAKIVFGADCFRGVRGQSSLCAGRGSCVRPRSLMLKGLYRVKGLFRFRGV